MPHRHRLPPLPAAITTRSRTREIAGYQAIRRTAQTGELRQERSDDPAEDAMLQAMAARSAGASSAQIRTLAKPPAPEPNRFFKVLEAISLPFEAFTEGLNALIGPAVPQEAFRERSERSRDTLARLFGGELSIAEAAGELRETHRERSMVEQILTGFLFDPLNVLIPGAVALRTGLKAGVRAGLEAGVRTGAEFAAPFVGGKVVRRVTDIPTGRRPAGDLRALYAKEIEHVEVDLLRRLPRIAGAAPKPSELSIDELRKLGGGIQVPDSLLPKSLPVGFKALVRERLPEILSRNVEEAKQDERLLRQVAKKSERVARDEGEFSSQEAQFLEEQFGFDNLSDAIEPLIPRIRDEAEKASALARRLSKALIDVEAVFDEAEAQAIERGLALATKRFERVLPPIAGAEDSFDNAEALASSLGGYKNVDMPTAFNFGMSPNQRLAAMKKAGVQEGSRIGRLVTGLLEPFTLRGATAYGAERALHANQGILTSSQTMADVGKAVAKSHKGSEALLKLGSGHEKISGSGRMVAQFIDLEFKKLHPKVMGFTTEAARWEAMKSQIFIFDGRRGISFSELDEFIDWEATARKVEGASAKDIRDGVVLARKVIDEATQWAEQATIGKIKKGKKFITGGILTERIGKKPLTSNYFPLAEERVSFTDLTKKRPFSPGSWSKPVQVDDIITVLGGPSWHKGQPVAIKYHHYLDSAFDYVADLHRHVADRHLLDFMKEKGFFPDLGIFADRVKITEGLDRLLEMRLLGKKGLPLKFEGLDEVFLKAGKLGTELLKATPKQAKALEEPIRDFINLVRTQDQVALKLRIDMKDLVPKLDFPLTDAEKALGAELREWKMTWEYFNKGDGTFKSSLKNVAFASTWLRFFQAGIDLSAPLIHGMVMLLTDPKNWSKATWRMLQATWDPEVSRLLTAKGSSTRLRSAEWGVLYSLAEPTEAASSIEKALGTVPGPPGRFMQSIVRRAEAAFTTFQDSAKELTWEALEHLAGNDPKKLFELGRFVNKLIGVYNPAYAGLPEMQKYIETAFISFAPMYRRASFGLVADMMKGVAQAVTPGEKNLAAELAVKRLALFAMVGVTMMGGIPKLTGNNPDALDPTSPKFLTMNILDHHIGIGTAFYSLVRLIANVTEQAMDPETRGSLAKFNIDDNKLLRWWRSQGPPLPTAAIDLAVGRTFIGEPLRGEDGDFTEGLIRRWTWRQITPIAVEGIIDEVFGGSIRNFAVIAEGFGARTFPRSLFEEFRITANEIALHDDGPDIVKWRREQEKKGDDPVFSAMPILLRNRLRDKYPELQAIQDERDEDVIRRGTSQKGVVEYFRVLKANRERVDEGMAGVARAFKKGDINARDFRNKIGTWQSVLVQLQDEAAKRDEFQDAVSKMEDAKTQRSLGDSFFGDHFYNQYFDQIVRNPNLVNEDGLFLFDEWRRLVTLFRAEVGEEGWQYVQARRKAAREVPDLVQEYYDERELLRPYWEIDETLWKADSRELDLVKAAQALPQRDLPRFFAKNPLARPLMARLDAAKSRLRIREPLLDWYVVKWYEGQPKTPFATKKLNEWQALAL